MKELKKLRKQFIIPNSEKKVEDMKIESEADILEKQISEMAKDTNASTLEKVLRGDKKTP